MLLQVNYHSTYNQLTTNMSQAKLIGHRMVAQRIA